VEGRVGADRHVRAAEVCRKPIVIKH
jgi:hypothetical protein